MIRYEYGDRYEGGKEGYYGVNEEKNGGMYGRYEEVGLECKNVIFGGGLGEYSYGDMDDRVGWGLELWEKECNG